MDGDVVFEVFALKQWKILNLWSNKTARKPFEQLFALLEVRMTKTAIDTGELGARRLGEPNKTTGTLLDKTQGKYTYLC